MMNWTIPRRVAAGFAILLLAAVAVGATSLVRLRAVGGHVATLSSNTIPSVIALSRIIEANLEMLLAVRSTVLDTEPDRIEEGKRSLQDAIARGDRNIAAYRALVIDTEDQRLLDAAIDGRAALLVQVRRAEALAAEATGDCSGVHNAMHPLKTSASHVGALAVRVLAVKIEGLAMAGERERLPELLTALEAAMSEVTPRLREWGEGIVVTS